MVAKKVVKPPRVPLDPVVEKEDHFERSTSNDVEQVSIVPDVSKPSVDSPPSEHEE